MTHQPATSPDPTSTTPSIPNRRSRLRAIWDGWFSKDKGNTYHTAMDGLPGGVLDTSRELVTGIDEVKHKILDLLAPDGLKFDTLAGKATLGLIVGLRNRTLRTVDGAIDATTRTGLAVQDSLHTGRRHISKFARRPIERFKGNAKYQAPENHLGWQARESMKAVGHSVRDLLLKNLLLGKGTHEEAKIGSLVMAPTHYGMTEGSPHRPLPKR